MDIAWEGMSTDLDYYLVDVRNIPKEVWASNAPDGTHDYPYEIRELHV